jgi:hypothetical protein
VLGIRSLRTVSSQEVGDAAAVAFDLALSQDLDDLTGAPAGATVLGKLELWPRRAPPGWTARRWDVLKRNLIGAGLGWEVWVQWYEDRLWGRTRSEAHELAYVEVPDDLWKEVDDPARVNTWIMRRFEQLENQSISKDEQIGQAADAQPAALAGMPEVNAIPLQAGVATHSLRPRTGVLISHLIRRATRR